MSIESELRQAMSEQVAGVTAAPDLVAAVRRRRRRAVRVRTFSVVTAAAVLVGGVPLYRLVAAGSAGPGVVAVTPGCVADVPSRVVPPWARAGFTAKEPQMPYVLGAHGAIVAILFGNPLAAPPRKDGGNKILWVSRASLVAGDPLVIDARLGTSRITARRVILGGPGPSGVDLPQAGCWHLTLTWSGHTDTMDLRYTPQPG